MKSLEAASVSDITDLTAAILVGGQGTRLRSAVSQQPKVLAEVAGRPFLGYLLDQLAAAGIRNVVLCTGYLGEQVSAIFGDSYDRMRLVYSKEASPLGTAGALRLALPLFESNPVLVMNGDSFFEVNLNDFLSWHCARKADAAMLLTELPDTRRYGRVVVDDNGAVLMFDEKQSNRGSGWINAGIYFFSHRLLRTIQEKRCVSLEKEIFPTWIGRGLYGYQSQGRFLDIGTPEAFNLARRFFNENMVL